MTCRDRYSLMQQMVAGGLTLGKLILSPPGVRFIFVTFLLPNIDRMGGQSPQPLERHGSVQAGSAERTFPAGLVDRSAPYHGGGQGHGDGQCTSFSLPGSASSSKEE